MNPIQETNPSNSATISCPSCGKDGKKIKPITLKSLLSDEAQARISNRKGFRFCAEPGCELAYFNNETGERFLVGDVCVRIGQKATEAPHPVCYCFDHTTEEIENEVAQSGTSKIPQEITEKCRQGLDRCEETNPQGSCCLGNVQKALKEAQAKYPAAAAMAGEQHSKSGKVSAKDPGLLASTGAMGSAILSSACCWLPLLLIAFGASAAGVAGFFETYRPYFLGLTGVLLALGFYLIYFRRPKCEPGDACAVPNPKLNKFNKIVLWVATAVVLAFAFFPNYVGYLLGGSENLPSVADVQAGESQIYHVEGMTCEGCAANIKKHVSRVPGVIRAEVSYDSKTAQVHFDPAKKTPSQGEILRAIERAGFKGIPTNK